MAKMPKMRGRPRMRWEDCAKRNLEEEDDDDDEEEDDDDDDDDNNNNNNTHKAGTLSELLFARNALVALNSLFVNKETRQ